jgi:hypothetical protein
LQSETNQKLLFAQLQLDSLSAALENSQTPRDQLLARGFADACVYQLMAVWHSLLEEILASYKVQPPVSSRYLGPNMAANYIEACQQQGLVAPELNYTLKLAKNGQSCLGLLLVLFDKALVGTPVQSMPAENAPRQNAENLITIEQVGAPDSPQYALQQQCQQLACILKELKELVQHCRQTMQEY